MKRLFSTVFIIAYFICAFGTDNIAFKHLGVKDGLSDSQIKHITKDSQGFMWFSTSYGLNRYDGHTIKVFTRNSRVPYSLPENSIRDVQEDAGRLLWVHTSRMGYVYYDPEKETFHPALPFLLNKYDIPENPTLLYIDKEKNVWSYTDNIGAYFYNINEKKLSFFPINENFRSKGIAVSSITEDKNGILFIYNNGYIERIDRNTAQISYQNDFLMNISGGQLSNYRMFVDADGDYWIYADMGIWLFYS